MATVSLMYLTEPSAIAALTPPGWLLRTKLTRGSALVGSVQGGLFWKGKMQYERLSVTSGKVVFGGIRPEKTAALLHQEKPRRS